MTTSQTSFLSEVENGEPIPVGKLSYLRERTRNLLYDFIVRKFIEAERHGLTQAELARRIGKRPEVVNRMLGSPGNWRIDTISDLLVGIAAEELDPKSVSLLNRAPRNQQYPEWLQENLSDAHRVSRTDIKRLTTSTSGKTISIQEKPSPGNRKILSTSAAG
jgi:hypothetical protein